MYRLDLPDTTHWIDQSIFNFLPNIPTLHFTWQRKRILVKRDYFDDIEDDDQSSNRSSRDSRTSAALST